MTPIRQIARAAAVATLFVLPACGDSTGSGRDSGAVSFAYTGDVSGSFSANGPLEVDADGDPEYRSFGAGIEWLSGGTSWVQVVAGDPQGGGRGDVVFMDVPDPTGPRTYTVDIDCELDDCPDVGFMMDASWSDDDDEGGRFFTMYDGTIQVTGASGDRLRGTFSGFLVDFEDLLTGADNPRQIRIQNGTFDVPVFDEDEFPSFARSVDRSRVRAAAARLKELRLN